MQYFAVGAFDLPSNTFGETGVATTVVIAYKPKKNEQNLLNADYEVLMFCMKKRSVSQIQKELYRELSHKKWLEQNLPSTSVLQKSRKRILDLYTELKVGSHFARRKF